MLASAGRAAPSWRPLSRPGLGNSRLFTGRDYDANTKTYWYRARQYSPDLGRFLQRDPLGYADGANPYAYVANSPWGATDPKGTEKRMLYEKYGVTDSQYEFLAILQKRFNDMGDYFAFLSAASSFVIMKPDDNPILNEEFAYETYNGALNLKADESLTSSKYVTNTIAGCVGDVGMLHRDHCGGAVEMAGAQTYLADYGNVLYGYAGARAGLSYGWLEDAGYAVTVASGKKDPEGNEKEDRPFYKYGYALGRDGAQVSKEQILSAVLSVRK